MIKNWLFYIYNLYQGWTVLWAQIELLLRDFWAHKVRSQKKNGGHKNPLIQRGIFSTIGSSWDDIGVNDFSDIKKNIDLITMAMTAMKRQIRGFLLAFFSIVGWVDQISNIHIKYDIFDSSQLWEGPMIDTSFSAMRMSNCYGKDVSGHFVSSS